MLSAITSQQSFNGVVPIRVFIDGMETFDEKLIKSSCRKLSNILISPQKHPEFAHEYAKYDTQYKLIDYKNCNPSDIFRCIFDRRGKFLVSGSQANSINIKGKAIGIEKQICKEKGVKTSFDLVQAQKKYYKTISDILSSLKLRLTDKNKNAVILNINMKSNGKIGLTTFKMQPENISFTTLQ